MKWMMALVMLALPVEAQECFAGKPSRVRYSDGRVITIIQRVGSEVTYTTPQEGFQDSVFKTHLMLFPKAGRQGARGKEYRWSSRLPKLEALVPGFAFDLEGTMKSGDGEALPYRSEGEVLGVEEVVVGECPYAVTVVVVNTWLNDLAVMTTTQYLSPDLGVVLKSEAVPAAGGAAVKFVAVGLE